MAKRERGRRALQDEVSRRIQQIDEIGEEGARIRVPSPQPHPRDARGRKQYMAFDNLHGYAASVRAAVDTVTPAPPGLVG